MTERLSAGEARYQLERKLLCGLNASFAAIDAFKAAGGKPWFFREPARREAAEVLICHRADQHDEPEKLLTPEALAFRISPQAEGVVKEIAATTPPSLDDVVAFTTELVADQDRVCRAKALEMAATAASRGDTKTARKLLDQADDLGAALRGEQGAPKYLPLSEMIATALKPLGPRLATGFATLDAAIRGGIPRGRYAAVLGAPGAGKTSFAVQLMHKAAADGYAVVFLAADEPPDGIITRLGQQSGYAREDLEQEGAAGDAARASFAASSDGQSMVVIDPDADDSMRTIEDAHAALMHHAGERPRVLIVDSLQTAGCHAAEGLESLRERIDAKVACCKAFAKLGTIVIALSEMSRAGYQTGDRKVDRPALAAAKESGSVEYGVSLLLGLYSVRGESGLFDVEIGKSRLGGSKPSFRLRMDFRTARFAEVAMPTEVEREDASADKRMLAAKKRVRKAVMANLKLESQNDILAKCDGGRTPNNDAIREMIRLGELSKVGRYWRVATPSNEGTNAAE